MTVMVESFATKAVQAVTTLSLGLLVVLSAILLTLAVAIYRITLHPLASFPGPPLWAMTRLPYAYYFVIGRLPYKIAELHEEYGPTIRLAPGEISFIDEEAWHDIYVKKVPGFGQLQKNPTDWIPPQSGVNGLGPFPLADHVHSRIRYVTYIKTLMDQKNRLTFKRGNFAVAFSDRSRREQEPILLKYVSEFIRVLRKNSGIPLDMCKWYNFVTFDIGGELTFGTSFDCLKTTTLHSWIGNVFGYATGAAILGMTQNFWPLTPLLMSLVPKTMRDAAEKHTRSTEDMLTKRLGDTEPRKDLQVLVQPALKNLSQTDGVSYQELLETCASFILGGSETTATLLSGLTYYLLENPRVLAKLAHEVRTSFSSQEEINSATISNLTYLPAVLSEALRLFPPVPGHMRRVVPSGHHITISGHTVPPNTRVAVDIYSTGHCSHNFFKPKEFIPERWLADPPAEFRNDKRKVIQPFLVGPRACIGKAFAQLEMKLVLASLLLEFDLERVERKGDWLGGLKVRGFFSKDPLMVRLVPVKKE
ncbi:hypothetical protein HYFRA_00002705 [Hymenoscyphus fraxineus]|uniref:Cytochrome P450 n=1 Tax=Hymenoscyphus fraxineus TaxID=746836 RepID=A0A9N9Q0W7_9HELO|nr:hypothetical protein HYFRA_00002705 [Hymenoscyphus fraxineus]